MHSSVTRHPEDKDFIMKNQDWCIHKMDDVVFAGRNQAYGAFQLRRLYDRHMSRAMVIGVLFFLMAVSSPNIIQLIKGYLPIVQDDLTSRVYTLTDPPSIEPLKPPPPRPPEVKLPPIKEQIKFVPLLVVRDDDVLEEGPPPPMLTELEGKISGAEDVVGYEFGIDVSPEAEVPYAPPVIEEPVDDTPFTYVEQMPSFPGGMEAMYAFIRDHLDFPQIAKENRISGQVIVQFVVSKEGDILNAKVVRSLGGGCDEEALRVINSMPRWKPGMHNGRAVPVTFTIPMKFVLL